MNNSMTNSEFRSGMSKLLVLKVESRLPTDDLMVAYSDALARTISSDAWTHCVSLATKTQRTLPTPAWFIDEAQKYEQIVAGEASEAESQENREKLNTEFPDSVSRANIARLSRLTRAIGTFKE